MAELLDARRLGALAEHLLSDAAFVFAEPSPGFVAKGDSLYLAKIELNSGERWDLLVLSDEELARSLAANLLGIEEESEDAQTSSSAALAEWANMVAGSVAAEWHLGQTPCRIGIPVVTREPVPAAVACLDRAVRCANLVTEHGQHLAIALRPSGAE